MPDLGDIPHNSREKLHALLQQLKKKHTCCQFCGEEFKKKKGEFLSFHHLIPGIHEEWNLIPLCWTHHEWIHKIYDQQVASRANKDIKNYQQVLKSRTKKLKLAQSKLEKIDILQKSFDRCLEDGIRLGVARELALHKREKELKDKGRTNLHSGSV